MSWISSSINTYRTYEELYDEAEFEQTHNVSEWCCNDITVEYRGHFSTEAAARKAIESYGRERANIVYASFGGKTAADINRRIKETQQKKKDCYAAGLPCKHRSDTISCPKCGSKVSTRHLKNYDCPVCNAYSESSGYRSFMSDTIKKRLSDYEQKIEELKEKKEKIEKDVRYIGFYDFYCG